MDHPNISAHEISLGKNVIIDPSAKISGIKGPAKKIIIGDNVYIGASVQILCDDFTIGDYGKIHHHTNIHGYKPCKIGHNAWIGQYTIIDSIGGTTIGNNVGVGAHSQLWSHIKYGDTLEGCRFNSEKPLVVGNDVWFVGHCIVSPITAADRSMALVGSVVTKDMDANCVYAGSPARELPREKFVQFDPVTTEQKYLKMQDYLRSFAQSSKCNADKLKIVHTVDEFKQDGRSYFAVATRQYLKTQGTEEVEFMKFLLPEKAKFVPYK